MKRVEYLIASFALASLTSCSSDQPPAPLPQFPSYTVEKRRTVLPTNLNSLLILTQVGRQESSWFGPDYKNYHDFVESAASEVLSNNGFEIVAPRQYLQDIDRETKKSYEEISNDYALKIGKQHAASGVIVLSVGILEDNRTPPRNYYSAYTRKLSTVNLCYYWQYNRSWGYRWPNPNTNANSQPTPQNQHFVQVIVAARVLDVESGTLIRSENGKYEYWSPSSVASVVQEATKEICDRFSRH